MDRNNIYLLVLFYFTFLRESCGKVIPLNENRGVIPLNAYPVKPIPNFDNLRNEVVIAEEYLRLGYTPVFNNDEALVNKILMGIKMEEIEKGLANSSYALAGQHFFRAKPLIEQSKVFQFLKRMPKGAMLHGHNTAMVTSQWFIKNITYRPDIMMYRNERNVQKFTFRQPNEPAFELRYVQDLRKAAPDVESFDNYLESLINLKTPRPEIDYPDIDVVWNRFETMFDTVSDAIRYYPVFIDYHNQMLQELADDKVMYAEIRTGFGKLYDSSGQNLNVIETVRALKNVVESFKSKNREFYGCKFIYTAHRNQNDLVFADNIKEYLTVTSAYPEFVIGFDIVGQEKSGNPNARFSSQILKMPRDTKFFFHSGETNWYGAPMDHNMIDALLLNTTRLGHGFALLKHPVLWETVKRRRIGVEISPISNQVLHLVSDLRNHPAAFYMSQNIPIVIATDDPGFWDAKGVNYDFYYAFMAFAPENAGLETLKKLVWTSIEQSILTDAEWLDAQRLLQKQWNNFLTDIIKNQHQFV